MAPSGKRPLEYSLLLTAILCLLAAGAVMVYSASSAEQLLAGAGDPSHYLKRYLLLGLLGLGAMYAVSRHGLRLVRQITPSLLVVAFVLTVAVMLPGVGVSVNGATRWLAAGPFQFQPAELLKLALVLYAVQFLATRPEALRSLGGIVNPLLVVVGGACLLLLAQPDMGTAFVICMSIGCLLIAAGVPLRHLALIAAALAFLALVVAMLEPYRRERLTAFLDPWSDASDTGFQSIQSMIAIGSGGLLGNGLGESVQKIFYLPEAHTDMILAIIGEELGVLGIAGLGALYGLIAYAGFRAAKGAKHRYDKLLAAGITSLVLCQATLNLFAVMGMAPLTGVPLPFISFGNTNMIVLLAGLGLLLGIADGGSAGAPARVPRRPRRELRAVPNGRSARRQGGGRGADRDRRRRYGGTRRAGPRRRRRATG